MDANWTRVFAPQLSLLPRRQLGLSSIWFGPLSTGKAVYRTNPEVSGLANNSAGSPLIVVFESRETLLAPACKGEPSSSVGGPPASLLGVAADTRTRAADLSARRPSASFCLPILSSRWDHLSAPAIGTGGGKTGCAWSRLDRLDHPVEFIGAADLAQHTVSLDRLPPQPDQPVRDMVDHGVLRVIPLADPR